MIRTARIGDAISNSNSASVTSISTTHINTVINDHTFTTIATTRIMSTGANTATNTTPINTVRSITAITHMSYATPNGSAN